MGKIQDMTIDQLQEIITPELLRESCQQFQRQLITMPFQVLQTQTAKFITILPGVRNQLTFGELDGDAQLAPWSENNVDDADYTIKGRTLEVFPGNCAKNFRMLPLLHSIYGDSIAQGVAIAKTDVARKIVSLFAAKIGSHINDVVFVGGVRNASGTTTADLFNSFDTIIATEILAGNIAANKGNYIKVGAIDKTNAVEKLKEIWRAADKNLKGRGKVYMYISPEVYDAYVDDYQTRHGALPYNQSFDKVYLEGSMNRCEFAVLDNMAGSNYIKISVKQNFLLGTDIFGQENHVNVGVYKPWVCTFEYAGIYGEQIRSLSKEVLMVADITPDADPEPEPEPEPTPTKSDVTVSFEDAVKTAKVGVEFAGQVATTDPAGKTLAYTSSDTEVATVDQSTGAVTLVAAGTTLITAAFAGDDDYNPANASYALTVEPAGE